MNEKIKGNNIPAMSNPSSRSTAAAAAAEGSSIVDDNDKSCNSSSGGSSYHETTERTAPIDQVREALDRSSTSSSSLSSEHYICSENTALLVESNPQTIHGMLTSSTTPMMLTKKKKSKKLNRQYGSTSDINRRSSSSSYGTETTATTTSLSATSGGGGTATSSWFTTTTTNSIQHESQYNSSPHYFAFFSSDRRHTFQKRQERQTQQYQDKWWWWRWLRDRIRDPQMTRNRSIQPQEEQKHQKANQRCKNEKEADDKKDKEEDNYHDLSLSSSSTKHHRLSSWRLAAVPMMTLFSIFILFVAVCWNEIVRPSSSSSSFFDRHHSIRLPGVDLLPEWEWDRNVYFDENDLGGGGNVVQQGKKHQQSSSSIMSQNHDRRLVSLIATVTPERSLRKLTDVSSRVNRAYARQWQMDYTEYYAGFRFHGLSSSSSSSSSSGSCFDKAYVLKTIAAQQMMVRQQQEEEEGEYKSTSVVYDAIVLLPSDAVILDLDQNVVETLLPMNKLAAISGWNQTMDRLPSNSGVTLINLRHELATSVADLWWEKSQESTASCGADNGLNLLIDSIAELFATSQLNKDLNDGTDSNGDEDGDRMKDNDDRSEGEKEPSKQQQQQQRQWTDLVEPIREHSNGVLGDQSIKIIPGLVPGDRIDFLSKNVDACSETLQQTTASVCYRFYPRCEVVP